MRGENFPANGKRLAFRFFLRGGIGLTEILAAAGICWMGASGWAADLQVSPQGGEGRFTSIVEAIKHAQPGDTVHLDPAGSPYYEQALFANKSGTADAPIVLDGHGAVIDGSVPLKASEWEDRGDGLFRSTVVPQEYCHKVDPAYVARFYILQNGKMNRMGRSLKGRKAPYKEPDQLLPGEWTWAEGEKAFYLKIPAGASIESQNIRLPRLVSGVQITGQCHDLTIRNVTVTHVLNDGFALTVAEPGNTVRAIRFEDITAIECGDDGLSAHGDCEVEVDGFLSRGNSTGYCSQGRSVNRRVRIEDVDGVNIFPIGGVHEFSETVAGGNALRPVLVEAAAPFTTSELILKDCVLWGAEKSGDEQVRIQVKTGGTLRAERLTTWGISFVANADAVVEIRDSMLAGGDSLYILPGAQWNGQGNLWDIQQFRVGDLRFGPEAFAANAETIREESSQIVTPENLPPAEWLARLPSEKGANHKLLDKK